jgi:RNA polymerase sigma factor (TIGR02999 family)
MAETPANHVTILLERVRRGDRAAMDELLPRVYDELHRLAESALRRDRPGHTLQPTALINEAFLRLFGDQPPAFHDRSHFLGIVARVMRQVLVDYARARRAKKRGSGLQIPLTEASAVEQPPADLLLVDEALDRLSKEDPRLVTLVEMRFFAGMTAEETAEALGDSVRTVRSDLRYAQARLRQVLETSSHRP